MRTILRVVVVMGLGVAGCDGERESKLPVGAGIEVGPHDPAQQDDPEITGSCLDLAECLAACAYEGHACRSQWYDEDCAIECEEEHRVSDGGIQLAYETAYSCDVCADDECADRSEQCD